MKRQPHISIDEQTDEEIKKYAEDKRINYSWAVDELVTLGLAFDQQSKDIDANNKLLERLLERINYQTALMEQFFAEMELEGKSIANNSKGLRTFKNRYEKNKLNW